MNISNILKRIETSVKQRNVIIMIRLVIRIMRLRISIRSKLCGMHDPKPHLYDSSYASRPGYENSLNIIISNHKSHSTFHQGI